MPAFRLPSFRAPAAARVLALALALTALPRVAGAQASAAQDSALLLVFEHDAPVAHERSTFLNMGDSIVVTSEFQRTFADTAGQRHLFKKSMMVVVDRRDLGLLRYLSNQDFASHTIGRGVVPGDTSMTYYREYDGGGDALRLVQPPGRLFILDSPMFTLFDVLSRSLAGKVFTTRRVQLVALLSDTLVAPLATVTANPPDTLRLGDRRVVSRHYTLADESATYELWADTEGRLLRLTHPESGLRVERALDAAPAAPRPKRPRPKSR